MFFICRLLACLLEVLLLGGLLVLEREPSKDCLRAPDELGESIVSACLLTEVLRDCELAPDRFDDDLELFHQDRERFDALYLDLFQLETELTRQAQSFYQPRRLEEGLEAGLRTIGL